MSWLDRLPQPDPDMSKRAVFTHITPLPRTISRETAVGFLHDHEQMIEMNPLVLRHKHAFPPPNATQDEAENMTWYEITDEIQYIPGTAVKGEASYKAGFYDLPKGLQTHVFAPGGVDIQGKWTVGGNMPGEERETYEIGVEKPREGLYVREDVDLRCNVFLANFVKRNLKKSHGSLVEKLIKKADLVEETRSRSTRPPSQGSTKSDSLTPQQNSLLATPRPYNQSQQTSYTSRNPTPVSTISQLSKPVCSCLGTRHHPACRYYIDIYQSPDNSTPQQQTPFPPPEPRSAQPPPRAASWEPTPTTTYAREQRSACHCTGGVHVEGCPSYPGLRFVPYRSQTPPQQPTQESTYQRSHSRSYSKPVAPEPQRPDNDRSTFRPQLYGEQAELPDGIYSPSWPDPDMKPKPLMTRTPHGHAVVMELEGDMARQYYEYQAQRAAEM